MMNPEIIHLYSTDLYNICLSVKEWKHYVIYANKLFDSETWVR